MNYEIEEVYEHKGGDGKPTGQVEIRARLEDGRLACIAASKGADHNDAVEKYLAEAFPPPASQEDEA